MFDPRRILIEESSVNDDQLCSVAVRACAIQRDGDISRTKMGVVSTTGEDVEETEELPGN